MRKLRVFNQVSLDGYFVDARGDMSWAHKSDPQWNAFTAENARGGGTLLFGRVTYEMMASFWPTPAARERAPDVADAINRSLKVVFSRSLREVKWSNTKLVKSGLEDEVRALKRTAGSDLVVMGSGTIVTQLAQANLVDEYQIVLNPIVLGDGRTMFEGLQGTLSLKLADTRRFENGNVVLWYQPR